MVHCSVRLQANANAEWAFQSVPSVVVSGQIGAFRAEEKKFEDASLSACCARHRQTPWLKRPAHRPNPQRLRRRLRRRMAVCSIAPLTWNACPGCVAPPDRPLWPHLAPNHTRRYAPCPVGAYGSLFMRFRQSESDIFVAFVIFVSGSANEKPRGNSTGLFCIIKLPKRAARRTRCDKNQADFTKRSSFL